jgi:hypothetical protein
MVAALIFLSIVGLILYTSYTNSQSNKRSVALEELDLRSVCDALVEKHGWSPERAEAAREEYVRFLTLIRMRPGFMLVPWRNAEGQDDLTLM